MPVGLADSKGLGDLIGSLRSIAQQLEKWQKAGTKGAPHVEVEAFAKAFSTINKELQASGVHGENLRAHLGAIAASLRAAADALPKSR